MADNYLEKRYEEVFGNGSSHSAASKRPSLDILLKKNRSFRGYDSSYVVHPLQLKAIVNVNTCLASGRNAQRLRFHLVTKGSEADAVLGNVNMGVGLADLQLPLPGTQPEAFIIVCVDGQETPIVDIDLGISLQSMLLKAVEMGLGGLIVRKFDAAKLKSDLSLPLDPVAVLCIGKPAEKIELVPVRAGESLSYYRRDGVHYVPKIVTEDLLV